MNSDLQEGFRGPQPTGFGQPPLIELSPFEFLGRLADLVPPPLAPAWDPPTDWGELVQAHDDRHVFQASPEDLPVIDAVRTSIQRGG